MIGHTYFNSLFTVNNMKTKVELLEKENKIEIKLAIDKKPKSIKMYV